MPSDQILVFAILAGTLALFVWGRIRFDLVALLSLLAVVLSGLVPAAQAFEGFGHPAVITVAGTGTVDLAAAVGTSFGATTFCRGRRR